MDPVTSAILYSIIANLITDVGKYSLSRIIPQKSIATQIDEAYLKAIDKWAKNSNVRDKEELWTRKRKSQLLEYASTNVLPSDEEIKKFILLFEIEIMSHHEAWRFIHEQKFQNLLRSITNIESQVNSLLEMANEGKGQFKAILEHLELLNDSVLINSTALNSKVDDILKMLIGQNTKLSIEDGMLHWDDEVKYEKQKIFFDDLNGRKSFLIKNEAIVSYLRQFFLQVPWNIKIEKVIKSLKSSSSIIANKEIIGLIDNIAETKLNRDYPKIRYELLDILEDYKPFEIVNKGITELEKSKKDTKDLKGIRKSLTILDGLIRKPKYGKCFLITGSNGIGKTHYLYQSLEETFVKPLIIKDPQSTQSIESAIIDKFNSLSGQQIKTINDFVNICSGKLNQYKISIIIEDIEQMESGFYAELSKLVESCTLSNNIYWLLSINSNFLDKAIEHESFFTKYSPSYSSAKHLDLDLIEFGGWIDLDYLVKQEAIVSKIFHHYPYVNISYDKLENFQERIEDMAFSTSPFLAIIICEIIDQKKEYKIPDLAYLEIISELNVRFKSRYNKNLSSFPEIEDFINYASEFLLQNQNIDNNQYAVLNQIRTLATNQSIIEKDDHLNKTYTNMLLIGLMGKSFLNNTSNKIVSFKLLLYWEYFIAKKLVFRSDSISDFTPYNCVINTSNTKFKSLEENIYSFVLLLLDKNRNIFKRSGVPIYDHFFTFVADNIIPKASFWFSCPKMSLKSQERIPEFFQYDGIVHFENQHDLYALIHCIGNLKNANYTAKERLKDLQPFFDSIGEYNLGSIYLNIVKHVLSKVLNIEMLFDCIPCLHGCEIFEIQDKLAEYIIKIACNIEPNKGIIAKHLLNYLRKNQTGIVKQSEFERRKKKGKNKPWNRKYIREWIVHRFCIFIAHSEKGDSYSFFNSHNFYNADKIGFSFPIPLSLEREANISIGGLFGHHIIPTERFKSMLKELLKSNKKVDKQNCFHIIRHTVPTKGSNKIKIDKSLHQFLRAIYMDEELAHIHQGYSQLFEYNNID